MKGLYKHYKGGIYSVIGVGKHSETSEEFVVYASSQNSDEIWIRPINMFFEIIEINGNKIPRFELIQACSS